MKKAILASAVLLGCWVAWPYYALYDFAIGLDTGNPIILERRVDWDSLRRGLRDDVNGIFAALVATDASGRETPEQKRLGAGIAALAGPAIINQLIDAYVTPATIDRFLRHGIFGGIGEATDSSQTDERDRFGWGNIRYAFFSGGPTAFSVQIIGDRNNPALTLLFRWSGDWKLVRLFLPSDSLARVAFQRAKLANNLESWEAFLNYFGNGPFASEARAERQKFLDQIKEQERVWQSRTASQPAGSSKVILYVEDPAEPQGKRYPGWVLWRTEMISDSKGPSAETAVRGDITIPERQIQITWTLRRNTDKLLPASHTIELIFGPQSTPASVPGLLMKPTESERGVPLAGLSVKVTSSHFLIGLSAVDSDRKRNIKMMKDLDWFDIPLVFSNGERAILAMQKGVQGQQSFGDALREWGE